MTEDIFTYTKSQETSYQTLSIPVVENWEWNMYKHIRTTVSYKNSQYTEGDKENRPFKNIIRPILNVQYRAEGFDLKDIDFYVDSPKDYYKSFLIKKFHEKWGRINHMDTFIDELVESYVDFGGALCKKVNNARPEVVPLQQIAFCDQTDIISGSIGLAHFYSLDQLKEMEVKGWGKFGTTIDEVLTYAENQKLGETTPASVAKTPGKYVKVYEVHGTFPDSWMENTEEKDSRDYVKGEEYKFSRQIHLITFCVNSEGKEYGATLFRGKEPKTIFKLLKRDAIFGRALGLGGAEELFEPQVWTNYDIIIIKEMLDQASKVIYKTTDPSFVAKNKTEDMENGQTVTYNRGDSLDQLNTSAVNVTAFDNAIAGWERHAQQMGSANEAVLGMNPSSGTPFKLQELVVQQNNSLHEYRRGKIATFVDEEIYMDWVVPYISKEITKEQTFLTELTLSELQNVAENVVTNESNVLIANALFKGGALSPEEVDLAKEKIRKEFMKGGTKRFMQIMKGEMKDAPIVVKTNVAGKQADLSGRTDKLVNVFRTIIANPAVLQNKEMADLFNQIINASGLSPIDFSTMRVETAPTEPVKSPIQPQTTDTSAPPAQDVALTTTQ
jgi:hypothetical protein